jgi:AcrR family transcriptional regulator
VTPTAKSTAKNAKLGRPPRLSRETILDAGLSLLERFPDEPLTLTRVAKEVDAVPAALYRHVNSHDDLLDGVLARVLDGIRFEIRYSASWKTQVRDWMTCVRAHLLRYPAAVSIVGRRGRTSPAWFDASAVLVEILKRAGMHGARLAHSYLWITESTMGCVGNESILPYPEQVKGAATAQSEMTIEARKSHAALGHHLAELDSETFFKLIADHTIAALPEPNAKPTSRSSSR